MLRLLGHDSKDRMCTDHHDTSKAVDIWKDEKYYLGRIVLKHKKKMRMYHLVIVDYRTAHREEVAEQL